jgi:hypothetical protein
MVDRLLPLKYSLRLQGMPTRATLRHALSGTYSGEYCPQTRLRVAFRRSPVRNYRIAVREPLTRVWRACI